MSGDDEVQRYIAQMKQTLGESGQQEILRAVGEVMGAAAVEAMPDYPEPSGKPLPVIYQQTSRAQFRYKKVRGRAVKTGVVRKPPAPYMSKFISDRARRGFFGALKGGNIRVPYSRTGTLGKSITYNVTVQGTRGQVAVGTSIAYAPGVIGSPNQQFPYHRDHWWSLETEVAGMADQLAKVTAAAFILEVRKRMR